MALPLGVERRPNRDFFILGHAQGAVGGSICCPMLGRLGVEPVSQGSLEVCPVVSESIFDGGAPCSPCFVVHVALISPFIHR